MNLECKFIFEIEFKYVLIRITNNNFIISSSETRNRYPCCHYLVNAYQKDEKK